MPAINSSFRKKYGIPPRGDRKAPDSQWGFPLPPADHPQALKFARAVLSRAHQAKDFSAKDVAKQVAKAKAIVAKHNAKKKREANLREYVPAVPDGSWERQAGLIQKAAQQSDAFGGPANDDPKSNDDDTVRSWDIQIWASFPAQSRVIIFNAKTGETWWANFAITGEKVTFSKVKPAAITAESARGSWRSVPWVDTARQSKGGFAAAMPRSGETLAEFRKRVPGAMPANKAARLNETQKAALAAYLRGRKMRESATLVRSSQRLVESSTSNVAFREASVADDGSVKNVLLIRSGPGNRADRHWYTDDCIKKAVESGVFEGAQLYLDHPDEEEERTGVRSVRYLAGWYSDIVLREYSDPVVGKCVGAFGTLHPAVGNAKCLEIVRTCAEYAKRYPSKAYAGLSINALGDGEPDTIEGEQWNRCDEITECESVDIVTRAGAGGTITPLKESNRMAKTTMTAKQKIAEAKRLLKEAGATRNPLDLSLTVDADKVKDGITKLAESQKTKVADALKKIKEAGVTLTPEQDKAIDDALGLVDGGAIDKLLDEATGVSEDPSDETVEGEVMEDETMEEGDPADVEALSHDELKAAHKKLLADHAALKKSKVTESARDKGLVAAAQRTLRENAAKGICEELNIPETFRPRLVGELVEIDNAKKMREHAQAFDKAFIRPVLDGAGVAPLRESGRKSTIDFTFGEEN